MHGHDPGKHLKAILTALAGELEVVQAVAGDLNVTEANSGAIGALLTSIDALLTTIDADTGAIKTAAELLDDVVGTHDAADAGKNLKIGGPASVVAAASVDEGDRVDASFTLSGELRVAEIHGASMVASLNDIETATETLANNMPVITDDAGPFTPNVDKGSPIMGFATSDSVDANDVGVLAMGTDRHLKVTEDSGTAVKTAVEATQAAVEQLDDVVAAHDASDGSTKSMKTGSRAVAIGATPSEVAAGDRVDSIANRDGVPWVSPGHPNIERVTRKDTAAQTDTILKAVSAGQRWVTTGISILLHKECSEDSINALVETGTTRILEHPGIAPGSGVVETCGGAPIAIGADGDDLLWTCEVPTGGSITVQVSGYLLDA